MNIKGMEEKVGVENRRRLLLLEEEVIENRVKFKRRLKTRAGTKLWSTDNNRSAP